MLSARRLKYLVLHMGLLLFTLSAMVCLLASILFLLHPASSIGLPPRLQQVLPAYLKPSGQHGWGSNLGAQTSSGKHCDGQGAGDCGEWNLLYHLGGNGPWVPKVEGVVEGGIDVPEGCEVDMVHMMSRHGERYPTKSAGGRMIDLVNRMKAAGPIVGPLDFVNNWEYFTNSETDFEQLTKTGPYAGVLEAFTTGVKLSTRYPRIIQNLTSLPTQTYVWSANSARVVSTARHFSAGFFGLNSPTTKLIIIPETPQRGGNTLTPGDTCTNYLTDPRHGHDNGYTQLAAYQSTFLPALAARLSSATLGLSTPFTTDDAWRMMEMCGFELLVRGASPWCNIFTQDEWRNFEYARDVLHFYRAGPGNPYARAMGWLWLNATTNLLVDGPAQAGAFYASFVHDGDVVPMLAALGLFEEDSNPTELPVDCRWDDRHWKTSQITPMGGRIILERLTCGSDATKYVRFNVNDGIVALEGCHNVGPGGSCSLDDFVAYIKDRGEKAGEFSKVCGLEKEAPEGIEFLRQPGFGGSEQVDGGKRRRWWL